MLEPTRVLGTFCAALWGRGAGGGKAPPLTLFLQGLWSEGSGGEGDFPLLLPSCCPFVHQPPLGHRTQGLRRGGNRLALRWPDQEGAGLAALKTLPYFGGIQNNQRPEFLQRGVRMGPLFS